MPRIRCHYMDCVFVDEGFCSAAAVELDPGHWLRHLLPTDAAAAKDEWDEEEELDEWEDEEEEEDELWEEEEDEF